MNATNATLPTINTTSVGSFVASSTHWFSSIFLPTLAERIATLVAAPWKYPQMIYIITPMLITLLMMEFYFGRYTDEELGWNTAVGNSLVLIFVSVDLIKTVYPGMAPGELLGRVWFNVLHFTAESGEVVSTAIAAIIFTFGILLLLTDFFHWLPKRLAFFVSGSLPINLVAYLGIVLVYSNNTGDSIPLDGYTLFAIVLLFIGLWFFFGIIHFLEPQHRRDWRELVHERNIDEEMIVDEAPKREE